ncbi:MAG: hypothetical protein Kow0069_02170 [Promethearchaeota archaeon]
MGAIELTLTSGGTIAQGVATRSGAKSLPLYRDAAAVLYLDEEDFKKLGIMRGMPVKVTTKFGDVVVYCEVSDDGPHPGLGFIPRGPWMNAIIDADTYSSGCAHYKEVKAKVEPTQEKPLNMAELIRVKYLAPLKS